MPIAEGNIGPISLSFWVPASDRQSRDSALEALDHLLARCQAARDWVDVHLIIEDRKLELNRWRNVARTYARTDFVLMHDIDFWVPLGLRSALQEPTLLAALKEGKQAFVLPCFVVQDEALATQTDRFPNSKAQLLDGIKKGAFNMPNPEWQLGHGATNYPKWYSLPENTTKHYETVSPRSSEYEPYLLFNTRAAPLSAHQNRFQQACTDA